MQLALTNKIKSFQLSDNKDFVSEELKNELVEKYLKERQKGRDRYHSYTKRRKAAGYNRMPCIWLKLPKSVLLDLAHWMKSQEPETLIQLMSEDK